jgi:uncharacterized protein
LEKKSFQKAYDIKFVGLSIGKHVFDFHINDEFLSYYKESLVTKADISIQVELEKQSEVLFILHFTLKGYVGVDCDRCLTSFNLPVDDCEKIIMKVRSQKTENKSEDVIFVGPYDATINVADVFYELVLAQIPLKISCDLAGLDCNEEMLKKINETGKSDTIHTEDSPWTKLQDLKKRLKEE